MTDFAGLLRTLSRAGVEFILVGGAAATAHGSARLTLDVDLVYRRAHENIQRLVAALVPLQPYLRGAPPRLPFVWDEATVRQGLNFTLTTTMGALDLFGEIAGGGRGRGAYNKVPVFGILERDGTVRVDVVRDVTAESLLSMTVKTVRRGSIVYTDKFRSYDALMFCGYRHLRVDHKKRFATGKVYN